MMAMNAAFYGFTVAAARALIPAELGAVTALMGILLIGNVASLGLQAAIARRIAVAPEQQDEIVGLAARVTLQTALAVGAVVALSTLVLTPVLNLDSYLLVVLCGATLVPLTIMGGQAGVAQGSESWRTLTAIYLSNGFGRLIIGGVALVVDQSTMSAMIGIAIGAWAPVIAGFPTLRGVRQHGQGRSRRPLMREAALGTHALFASFVLSNLDALIARARFDAHESGLYAAGLILTKAALFLPQFVSVVLYPRLARDHTVQSLRRGLLLVISAGAAATLATAALPWLALILVGGDKYGEVEGRLWLFALSGSYLAIINLLVLDALARHAHGVVAAVWAAAAAVVAIALIADVHITGLVVTVIVVSSALAGYVIWRAGRVLPKTEPAES